MSLEWGRATGPKPIDREGITIAETMAHKEWAKQNTTFIGLKLNNNTDSDILKAIEGKPRQTEIKRLIREALKHKGE